MSFMDSVLSSVRSVIPGAGAGKNDTISRSYARTVFYGTFISLPRQPESPATSTSAPQHQLTVNHGALWVGAKDGRIEGFDWSIRGEEDLYQLIERMGWILESEPGEAVAEIDVVRIVKARPERNEFFFPGFIGEFPDVALPAFLCDLWLTLEKIPIYMHRNTPTLGYLAPRRSWTGWTNIRFLWSHLLETKRIQTMPRERRTLSTTVSFHGRYPTERRSLLTSRPSTSLPRTSWPQSVTLVVSEPWLAGYAWTTRKRALSTTVMNPQPNPLCPPEPR